MNWIYFHLLINHFPVVLAGIAFITMVVAVLIGRRQAWLYTAITLVLAGVFVYPTHLSGERSSRLFSQRMPSAREHIRSHHEAADITLWVLLGSGVLGLICWYRIGTDDATATVPGWVKVALTVPSIASAAAVTVTSVRGGHIGHQPWETSLSAPPVLSVDSTIRLNGAQPSPAAVTPRVDSAKPPITPQR